MAKQTGVKRWERKVKKTRFSVSFDLDVINFHRKRAAARGVSLAYHLNEILFNYAKAICDKAKQQQTVES